MGGLWAGTIYRVDGRDLNMKGIRIYEIKKVGEVCGFLYVEIQ